MLRRFLPDVYEGWLVAWSCAVVLLMLSATIFYGMGPLFNPMVEEFGWSVAAVSLAFSVRSEVNGLAAPFVGVLIDRVGTQRVMLFGITVMAIAFFLTSFQQELWHFYALMFFVAIGSSTSGGQVIMVSTVTWFDERRARALSYATAGGALGGLFTFAVAFLVEELGWRDAVRIMAVALFGVGLLAGSNVRNRPLRHHQPMDGRPRQQEGADDEPLLQWGMPARVALRSRAFLLLSLSHACMFFALTAVVVHQIPYLETRGITPAVAAAAAGAYSVTSFVGRLGSGIIADRADKRIVLAASVAIASAAMPLLILVHSIWVAVPVLALIGLGTGGANPLRTALMADYFGTTSFGSINGLAMFVGTIGAFLGPLAIGVGVDLTGSYTPGWVIATAASALAVPLVLLARPPTELMAKYRLHKRPVGVVPGTAERGVDLH